MNRKSSLLKAAAVLTAGLATSASQAQVVHINLTSAGSPTRNITGLNAGKAFGDYKTEVSNFILNDELEVFFQANGIGLDPDGDMQIAVNGGFASPTNFGAGATIDGSVAGFFTGSDLSTTFWNTYGGSPVASPNFGPNSFIGFRAEDDSNPGNYRYGYIEVLWNWTGNESTSTFQLLSAAYETQWNTGIVAGASATTGGGGAVPEPGEWAAMGILGAGLTGLVIRKRRNA